MLTGSPLSEPCAPCCATTAATLGDTSLRCGTTTIATTAATAAADAAIQGHRRRGCEGAAVIGTTTSSVAASSLVGGDVCVHRVPEARGRVAFGKPAQRVARGAHLGQLLAPLGRGLELRLDRGALGVGELAVEVRRQHVGIEGVVVHVAHGPVTPSATSAARNRRRPRWMRDRTVPIGTPVASAICS